MTNIKYIRVCSAEVTLDGGDSQFTIEHNLNLTQEQLSNGVVSVELRPMDDKFYEFMPVVHEISESNVVIAGKATPVKLKVTVRV